MCVCSHAVLLCANLLRPGCLGNYMLRACLGSQARRHFLVYNISVHGCTLSTRVEPEAAWGQARFRLGPLGLPIVVDSNRGPPPKGV